LEVPPAPSNPDAPSSSCAFQAVTAVTWVGARHTAARAPPESSRP
jgi:hypothetical protein